MKARQSLQFQLLVSHRKKQPRLQKTQKKKSPNADNSKKKPAVWASNALKSKSGKKKPNQRPDSSNKQKKTFSEK
jgi:hypothetical protein